MIERIKTRFDALAANLLQQTWGERSHQFSLFGFLTVSIIMSLVLVLISAFLYVNNPDYALDITRPGLNGIPNQQLIQVNDNQNYNTTGPVTSEVINNEKSSIQSQLNSIQSYNGFSNQQLNNLTTRVLTDCGAANKTSQQTAICAANY
ncbi:MAG TPA: hypothetical protein VGS28_04020 [Candidatus Saccharimonadales bacterium]|nr:hypothetical protein [Candidatus Saccharimonadales bacterium]